MTNITTKPNILFKAFSWNAQTVGTFDVGVIPAGQRVLSASVYYGALGASTTLSLGVSGSATLFVNAADSSSAGKSSMTDTIAGGVGGISRTTNRVAILTLGGATTTSSARDVLVKIELVEDFAS